MPSAVRHSRHIADDPVVRLVDRIYEGSVDTAAWPRIIAEVASMFDASKGRLFTPFVPPDKGGLGISVGIPEAALQQWATRYLDHDIWNQAAVAKNVVRESNIVLDSDLLPEREFVDSRIYREHLSRLDIGRVCCGVVFDEASPGAMTTILSIYRGISARPFDRKDRERMKMLVPHLSRSLGVMYRLRDAELKAAASLSALDRLLWGIVILDPAGRAIHVNAAARRTLEMNDGLCLSPDGPCARLAVSDPLAETALAQALSSLCAVDITEAPHFSSSVQIPRRSGQRPFVLQFAPLPERNEFHSGETLASAILFIIEQDRIPSVDAGTLKTLFGITISEARLASLLCAGKTLVDAAAHSDISETTARTQLASLFQKTSTHRQADLVRLLISLSAGRE